MPSKIDLNRTDLSKERLPAPDRIPQSLYKYRSLLGDAREHARLMIVRGEIYLATSQELNDPFDCSPACRTEANSSEQLDYMRALAAKMKPQASRKERLAIVSTMKSNVSRRGMNYFLGQSVRNTLSEAGIFSLSAKPNHPLMWSHYADSHRGICIEFNWDALRLCRLTPINVEYSNVRPIVDPILDSPGLTVRESLLTKADVWEYEAEWRSIGQGKRGVVRLPPETVTGIVLGGLIHEQDRAEVRQWAADSPSKIAVYEAALDPLPRKSPFRTTGGNSRRGRRWPTMPSCST
jgi:hypothetical protein